MTLYRERLWPSPGVFLALLLIIPASLLIFLPINAFVGAAFAVMAYCGVTGLMVATSPIIEVTERHLRAGRGALPLQFVGEAVAYTGAEATAQRGPNLDARAWMVIRGWVSPVVRIEVTDPADPTPYWLVSTRRPDSLVTAVREATRRTPGR
jgi:hypothetical protein